MCVSMTKNYLNVFSCEDEQRTGANISSWKNWIDGKLGTTEGAVMGRDYEFR